MKKSILLFEVLIAFTLVSLCTAVLVKRPLEMIQVELKRLEKLEMERLADWSFTEVKELLLKNEIPWEAFPEKGERGPSYPLPDAILQIPQHKEKRVRRSFYLTGRGIRQKGEIEMRQLGVYIELNEERYQFRTPVQKI